MLILTFLGYWFLLSISSLAFTIVIVLSLRALAHFAQWMRHPT